MFIFKCDQGITKELNSWRWKLIYYLATFYTVLFSTKILTIEDLGYLNTQTINRTPKINEDISLENNIITKIKNKNNIYKMKDLISFYENNGLNSKYECEAKSARLALGQLVKYKKEREKQKDPIILSGTGDSGTRAVSYLVTQLGVWMGKFGVTVKKDSRDSKLFIDGFETLTCSKENETVLDHIKSYNFYSNSLDTCKTTNYNSLCVKNKDWNQGIQWTAALFRTLMNHTKVYTSRKVNQAQFGFGLWGFKHPRASVILPYIHHVNNGRLKYIHIIRDGRDVASGDNHNYFKTLCKRYHNKNSPLCIDSYENRIELWSRLNLDVVAWAKYNLHPDKFIILRIEDLVKGNKSCFYKIAKFVGTTKQRAKKVMEQSVKLFTIKQNRYFGRKYPLIEAKNLTRAVQARKKSIQAFKYFGYNIENWGTFGKC